MVLKLDVELCHYEEKDGKPAPLRSMIKNSSLSYTYGSLRGLVRNHHITDMFGNTKDRSEELVDFVRPELIVTQTTSDLSGNIKSTFLKHVITFAAILEFIQLNRNLISDDIELRPECDRKKTPDEFEKLSCEFFLEALASRFDADIVEIDDEFPGQELLFVIILNRTEKRFVCVFRGSYNISDWSANALSRKARSKPVADALGKDVGVHRGFSNYIFNENKTAKGKASKFDQMVTILKELRERTDSTGEDYKKYEIFVTGHSLGGALSQLFSASLAKSSFVAENCVPLPITAVTYASPMCGDCTWLKEYQSLEKKGSVRHLRVSNQGDAVCVMPSFPATFPLMGYTQTGVNIHVIEGSKAELKYVNNKSFYGNFEASWPLAMHSLTTYTNRLFNDLNKDILDKSVEDLYEEHAGDYITK